ncbi:hypothetical protein [Butyrivibrio sp. AE3004]|uniref:hypothetical protein n=1 Tax=Butyrivibrio sp. AE3004 TaxID=1506994 RepID=UPI00049415CF|nr:hypothetical protein [Butyrivibrio sp. AE3004]
MNSDSSLLRRYEDNLNVCGLGVIILGAWDVLKVIMQVMMNMKDATAEMLSEVTEEEQGIAIGVLIGVIAVLFLITALIFLIHYYIGINASRAAKGMPYKKGYFVWAVILLVVSILGMLSYVDEIKDLENIETTIASIIVDITAIYILGTVVISTRKIKNLRQ